MDILSLPLVMIEHIISYLSYDEIARCRPVCKTFNEICMRTLSYGFLKVERRHGFAIKSVKTQLPRRESERRNHPLSRHFDILTSIETRISMLNMTYYKFIDNRMCCFIPGRVIDEIKRVLNVVENCPSPPRAHELLQELRDISSMAIEHFDEKISPAFRRQMQEGTQQVPANTRPQTVVLPAPAYVTFQEYESLRRLSTVNAKLTRRIAQKHKIIVKHLIDYRRVVCKQQNIIRCLVGRKKEQDEHIADLKKRLEEHDIKLTEMLMHSTQAAGGKAITGEASSAPQRHFSSQIKLDLSVLPIGTSKRPHDKSLPNMKPRKPIIKLPSISEDDPEPPQKISKMQGSCSNILPSICNEKIHWKSQMVKTGNNLSEVFNVKFKRTANLDCEDIVPEKKLKID